MCPAACRSPTVRYSRGFTPLSCLTGLKHSALHLPSYTLKEAVISAAKSHDEMTKQWELVKDRICQLVAEGHSLTKIRECLVVEHKFDAS